jgi:hypothetical protein
VAPGEASPASSALRFPFYLFGDLNDEKHIVIRKQQEEKYGGTFGGIYKLVIFESINNTV